MIFLAAKRKTRNIRFMRMLISRSPDNSIRSPHLHFPRGNVFSKELFTSMLRNIGLLSSTAISTSVTNGFYYIDTSVLLENTPLVKFIRLLTRVLYMSPVKIELSSHKGPMISRLVEHVQLLTTWLTPFRVVPDDYDRQ